MSRLAEEFARSYNVLAEPILLLSSSGHLCGANQRARRDLGLGLTFAPDELIFSRVKNDPKQVSEYLRSCSRSGEPLPSLFKFQVSERLAEYRTFGCTYRSRDDQQRPLVILRLTPRDPSTSRFVGLNQQIEQLRKEVARRIQVEGELEQQRKLLEVTLTSIGDAVMATDVEGNITFVNAAAESHTGYSAAESVGKPLQSIFVIRNEETGHPVENPVQRVLLTGEVVGLANHTVLVRKDGTELPIDDSAAPIRDAAGRLLGVVLVFHEISESRKLQRELVQQAEALKEADRRKDQFLAVLAHELRNPLAPMRNGLSIARRQTSDPTMKNVIEMMNRQLLQLVRLVDDLMDVSRVTRGVVEIRRAPLLISDVVARSLEAVRSDVESRKHELRVELPAESLMVAGDADRLTQVLSNLLANSAKYSVDASVIVVRVNRVGDAVEIKVSDHGIGIPRDQLNRVFDMFSQVRAHQGHAEGGLGIGLSLVRTLVELHGGSVEAESEGPNRGSTFTVRLPLLQSGSLTPFPSSIPQPSTHSGPALRIVVADDNVDAARSLGFVLELEGHDVRFAADGYETVQVAADFQPHIIFMDIGMPRMDGIEAIRRIRELPNAAGIYIAALTGWGQPQDRERTRQAGADRHIVKPLAPEELPSILAQAALKAKQSV